MDRFEEIRELEPGRYSFFIGVHQYTLSTTLDRERIVRVVSDIRQLVDAFPAHLSQDQRFFLSLMTIVTKLDRLETKVAELTEKLSRLGKQD